MKLLKKLNFTKMAETIKCYNEVILSGSTAPKNKFKL